MIGILDLQIFLLPKVLAGIHEGKLALRIFAGGNFQQLNRLQL